VFYPLPVDRDLIFAATAQERRRIADLIDDLDEVQLATPSLCSGWDVKTVAAHIACSVADGLPAQWKTALRRGSLARATDEFARRRAQLPAAEIAATLRERADYRLSPPVVGPVGPLTDILITAAISESLSASRSSPMPDRLQVRWTSSPERGRWVSCVEADFRVLS
jgi:hypothetical protein